MQKDAFHQAVVGGLSLHGVLTADGPAIVGHAVRGRAYAGGVALVVSGLRRFVPEHFGKGPGPWDWYIVKYRSEARVLLDGFTTEQVRRMRVEFGLLPIDEQHRPESAAQAFYASRAWAGLVCVAARNDVGLDAQSRTVSGAHWLRLRRTSDAGCWRMGA